MEERACLKTASTLDEIIRQGAGALEPPKRIVHTCVTMPPLAEGANAIIKQCETILEECTSVLDGNFYYGTHGATFGYPGAINRLEDRMEGLKPPEVLFSQEMVKGVETVTTLWNVVGGWMEDLGRVKLSIFSLAQDNTAYYLTNERRIQETANYFEKGLLLAAGMLETYLQPKAHHMLGQRKMLLKQHASKRLLFMENLELLQTAAEKSLVVGDAQRLQGLVRAYGLVPVAFGDDACYLPRSAEKLADSFREIRDRAIVEAVRIEKENRWYRSENSSYQLRGTRTSVGRGLDGAVLCMGSYLITLLDSIEATDENSAKTRNILCQDLETYFMLGLFDAIPRIGGTEGLKEEIASLEQLLRIDSARHLSTIDQEVLRSLLLQLRLGSNILQWREEEYLAAVTLKRHLEKRYELLAPDELASTFLPDPPKMHDDREVDAILFAGVVVDGMKLRGSGTVH